MSGSNNLVMEGKSITQSEIGTSGVRRNMTCKVDVNPRITGNPSSRVRLFSYPPLDLPCSCEDRDRLRVGVRRTIGRILSTSIRHKATRP